MIIFNEFLLIDSMLQVRAFHSPHLLNLFAVYYVALVATPVYAATYVPGKAFDRFVTIWLENEVHYSLFFFLEVN